MWNFHPKPQAKLISITTAIRGADISGIPLLNDKYGLLYNKIPPGKSAAHVIGKGWNSCIRPKKDKPSPTLPKMQTGHGFATMCHPTENRALSIGEAKRIHSFPDHFIFSGNYSIQWERIGNSVPPNLM